MLYGLMGALLSVKKTSYAIGDYPTYLISGQPGAEILWTTWINNIEQERDMPYGDFVGPDGTLELRWADPFYKNQGGTWKRTITLLNPDGSKETATVTFTVGGVGTMPDTTAPIPTPVPVQTPPTIPPRSSGLDAFYKPISRSDTPRTIYPSPGTTTLPPVGRDPYQSPPYVPPPTPPPVYEPAPDILNPPAPSRTPVLTPVPNQPIIEDYPEQIPPRSIYPTGQEPRTPIGAGRDTTTPRSTADMPPLGGGDILNPPQPSGPTGPMVTSPPIQQPTTQQPTTQAPGLAEALGGSVNIGGYQIPIVVLGGAFLLLFMGGRR